MLAHQYNIGSIRQVNVSVKIGSKDAVIILGAGIMQIPIIKSANNMGIVSIVFDGNKNAPGKNYSNYFENIDLKDNDSLLKKSLSYKEICNVKAVFTAGTDFSYMVAWLSEKLGLKSISYETALKATDKSLMREAFLSSKVTSPLFIITTDINIDEKQVQKIGYPVVVKPVDSMGARGAVKINEFSLLKEAIKEAIKFSRSGKVIIEQFLQGPEFSLDAVIKNGDIHICGVADRHIFFPPYFVEMGHTMPSAFSKEVLDKVSNVFCDGIRAIGIDNGTAKGDIKYTDKKAVVGEIAARLSGGYMSGWTFPYSTDFSVIDAALKIALDMDPGAIKYSYKKTAAERAFISIPGIVDSIYIPDYLKNRSKDSVVKELFINVAPGDKVNFPKNNVEKCGNIIAVHKERSEAVFAAEEACRNIIIRLKPGDKTTFDFIFGKKEEWIPDAFVFDTHGKNNIDSIPDFYGNPDVSALKNKKIDVFWPDIFGNSDVDFTNDESFGTDWHGNSLKKVIQTIEKFTNIRFIKEFPGNSRFALGRVFWKSVQRGSIQGAIWIADTIVDYIERGTIVIADYIKDGSNKIADFYK